MDRNKNKSLARWRGRRWTRELGWGALLVAVVASAGCGDGQKNDQKEEPKEDPRQCPAMIDASCYPRGNYTDADEGTARTQAFQLCENERRNCIASQARERAENQRKCTEAQCKFGSKFEDEKCKPTWSGQPCTKTPEGLFKCSYMSETNHTSYTCDR